MEKTEILQLAQNIVDKQANQDKQQEVKENNQSLREYTLPEKMVFDMANKNLHILDMALNNAMRSEISCDKIIKDVQPNGDNYNKYQRIIDIISKYEASWKHLPIDGKAPKVRRSYIEPLTQKLKLK